MISAKYVLKCLASNVALSPHQTKPRFPCIESTKVVAPTSRWLSWWGSKHVEQLKAATHATDSEQLSHTNTYTCIYSRNTIFDRLSGKKSMDILKAMLPTGGLTFTFLCLSVILMCESKTEIGDYIVDCSACNSVPRKDLGSYSCKVRCEAEGKIFQLVTASNMRNSVVF